MDVNKLLQEIVDLAERGGPGSGNFGHAGRPGEVGGSGGGEGDGGKGDSLDQAHSKMMDGIKSLKGGGFKVSKNVATKTSGGRQVRIDGEAYLSKGSTGIRYTVSGGPEGSYYKLDGTETSTIEKAQEWADNYLDGKIKSEYYSELNK